MALGYSLHHLVAVIKILLISLPPGPHYTGVLFRPQASGARAHEPQFCMFDRTITKSIPGCQARVPALNVKELTKGTCSSASIISAAMVVQSTGAVDLLVSVRMASSSLTLRPPRHPQCTCGGYPSTDAVKSVSIH